MNRPIRCGRNFDKCRSLQRRVLLNAKCFTCPACPLPSNFLQFEYLGFIVAGVYCTLLSWSAWAYHVVGDYNVETDFYWSYIPKRNRFFGYCINRRFSWADIPAILGLFGWVTKDFFTAVFASPFFPPAAFLSSCFIHGRPLSLGYRFCGRLSLSR